MQRILAFVLLFAVLAYPSIGQEIHFVNLPGSGAATIILSREPERDNEKRFAAMLDGGGPRREGASAVIIDGHGLFEWLKGERVEGIDLICSHPHEDHLGGLVTFVKDPRINDFEVRYIASDREASLAAVRDGLGSHVEKNHIIEARAIDAKGTAIRDVLGRIEGTGVRMANAPYTVTSRHPHGNALVVLITIQDAAGNVKHCLVTDDASSSVLSETAKWLEREGFSEGGKKLAAIVGPHHGSAYNDFSPLLKPGLKPSKWILSVEPNNPYPHPAPTVLVKLIEAMGAENVYLTGHMEAGSHLRLTPKGLIGRPIADGYWDFVRDYVDRAHRHYADESKRQQQRIESLLPEQTAKERKKLAFAREQVAACEKLRRTKREEGLAIQAPDQARWRDPGGFFEPDAPKSPKTPPTPSSGGLRASDEFKKVVEETRKKGKASDPGVSSVERRRGIRDGNLKGKPSAGGVIIFGVYDAASAPVPLKAGIEVEGNIATIYVTYRSKNGKEARATWRCSTTELVTAYRFIDPKGVDPSTDLEAEDAAIVNSTVRNDAIKCSWHPAIDQSEILVDVIRLDCAIGFSSERRAGRTVPPGTRVLQWYDVDSRIVVDDKGVLNVVPKSDPTGRLLRIRFFGTPDYLVRVPKRQKDLLEAINREAEKRFAKSQFGLPEPTTELLRKLRERERKEFVEQETDRLIDEYNSGVDMNVNDELLVEDVAKYVDAYDTVERWAKLVTLLHWLKDAEQNEESKGNVSISLPHGLKSVEVPVSDTWTYDELDSFDRVADHVADTVAEPIQPKAARKIFTPSKTLSPTGP